jgi:hypothetical protein
MAAIGRYDGDLQMFVEEPHDVKRAHLGFLRWLVERRRLEHSISGPPSGALAEPPSVRFQTGPACRRGSDGEASPLNRPVASAGDL